MSDIAVTVTSPGSVNATIGVGGAVSATVSSGGSVAVNLPGGEAAWANITGKPTEFTPSAHTHKAAEITDFESAVQAIGGSSYTLPTATDTTLGGVKIGSGITITDGVISADGGGGVSLSDVPPQVLGTASAGTGPLASRDDHVHPMPNAADVGALDENSIIDGGFYEGAIPWDISTAVFSQSFSVETPAAPRYSHGVFFRADGLKMYIIGDNNSLSEEYIDEYTLGSAWDITTATRVQNLNVFAQEAGAFGVFFKPDGMKLYFVGIGGDAVNEYSLGTAWDISTASFSQDFDLSSQTAGPTGIFFKPDGLGMYIAAFDTDEVHQYALASPWNIGTATHSQSVSVQAQDPASVDLFFKPDGSKMYVVGTSNDIVSEYNLGTAWDIATATFLQSFSFAADGLNPWGVFFKPDGLKMFVVSSDNLVYEYSLG